MKKNIILTGGLGYIGSHVCKSLMQKNYNVTIIDDMSTGKNKFNYKNVYKLDVSDTNNISQLKKIFKDHDAVIHFAAKKQVGESVEKPDLYYRQNIGGLANIITAMKHNNVKKLIFSSSAAVYGMPNLKVGEKIRENIQKKPINAYGETKYFGEFLCKDSAQAFNIKCICLRYFNVAGAGHKTMNDPAILNLIPMVFDKLEQNKRPMIFGNDYNTPDGTCVRDYIHVSDLTDAHISALEYLEMQNDGYFNEYNVSTEKGNSVKEVIETIKKETNKDFDVEIKPRRAGDPAYLVGDASKIKNKLKWTPKYDINDIVKSAYIAWRFDKDNN
jgi:UDP-glucose 4-epimerase